MVCMLVALQIGKKNAINLKDIPRHISFNRFSGLVGALGGGLSSLSGYNGLPSVLSGLDDSLSDVAPRKKYPFELEKAIHNVMFIQHHMQRQDEFNAVSR